MGLILLSKYLISKCMRLKFNSILGTQLVHFLGSLTFEFLDKSEDGALGLAHKTYL